MARQFQETKVKKKSRFSKIIKRVGITILLLLIVLISLPFIFKGKLVEIVKQEVNNAVNAKVEWGDFDLTLISSFPNFSFDIQDVKVTGVDEFEGVTLADIKNTSIDLDLMSVISGGKIKVKKIEINEPKINILVNGDSLANYDIAKTDSTASEVETPESTEPTQYEIGLKNLSITDADITYTDEIANLSSTVRNMDFELSGDFTQDIYDAETITTIEELTVSEGPVDYMNKTNVELKADLIIDKFVKYTLKENNLKLNELEVGFDGWVELLEDATNMDLTFNSKKTDFKSILSLVPAVYLNDFSSVKTKGKFALDGEMKGEMKGENFPSFDLNMEIADGYFKYPDLPNAVENINISTKVDHPQGDLDKMKIDVSKFRMELADNPINGNLKVSTPMSDPNISSAIKAKLDLSKLKTVVPMEENEKLNGQLNADLELAGRLSSITNEQYQDFKAQGDVVVSKMLYTSKDLPYDVTVNSMEMGFSPQYVDLRNLDTKIGNSDLKAKGKIDNILPYLFNNEVLKGNVMVTSNKLDIDDLTRSVEGEETSTATESDTNSSYEVIRVPAYYDLNMTTDIKELIYDGTSIENVKGSVGVKDQIANLSNVSMDMLDGNIVLDGSYNTQKNNPKVNFDYKVKNVDIQKTTEFFSSFETIAPVAKHCKGKFSTNLNISTDLDKNMEPIYSSINGKGGLFSNNLTVEGVKALQKMAGILKLKDLASQNLNKLKLAFQLKDGRAFVNPFDLKLSGIPTNVEGSTGFDQTISYLVKMKVPKAKLGGKANDVMGDLLGKVNIGGKKLEVPNVIPVSFKIGGTVTSPKVDADLKNKATSYVTDLKDKVVDTVKKSFNAEIDKIMKQANERAQQLRDESKKQTDKLRSEGKQATQKAKDKADQVANDAKKKADDEAQKLSNKGGNFIEKAANKKLAKVAKKKAYEQIEKAKKEAYKKAEIPEKQAEDKAQKIEAETEKKAQAIIDAAQQRADKLKQ
ncbi:MAG: AsmA-like C-terminal region-containing protein [Flavobacteriales bacterium]